MCHPGCATEGSECVWCDIEKKAVWVNGCFDVLHRGHLELFKFCKQIAGRDVEETFSTLQADLEMAERYNLKIKRGM